MGVFKGRANFEIGVLSLVEVADWKAPRGRRYQRGVGSSLLLNDCLQGSNLELTFLIIIIPYSLEGWSYCGRWRDWWSRCRGCFCGHNDGFRADALDTRADQPWGRHPKAIRMRQPSSPSSLEASLNHPNFPCLILHRDFQALINQCLRALANYSNQPRCYQAKYFNSNQSISTISPFQSIKNIVSKN